MDACLRSLRAVNVGQPYPEIDQLLYDIRQDFASAMDDDLNISAAMAGIFKKIKQINILIEGKRIDAADASKIVEAFRKLDAVLNIFDFSLDTADPEIEQLLKRREQARKAQNWALADQLREQLESRGIIVRDRKIQTG